eukprot:TRINITY_DN8523_c0_g1_i3.p1 TRINITY_DN8523_c0_g1~~TRINITY_DN8523_c0_g1_i3.p1  ORF type:complete len:704 (+),score=188.27 TRINITY_DN8523_c0_g1_i3:87-2114(+)
MDSNQLFQYEERCRRAEKELTALRNELADVQAGRVDKAPKNAKLADAVKTQAKLKYQLDILAKATETDISYVKPLPAYVLKEDASSSVNLMAVVRDLFSQGIDNLYPKCAGTDPLINIPSAKLKTDALYQSNVALKLTGLLSGPGGKINPRDLANSVVTYLPPNDIIEKCEVAGPGFINIHINKTFLEAAVTKLVKSGPLPPPVKKLDVIVDLSSPNIAKEMHVGHLRSTIIGDSIARILEYVGHNVQRINHVGDWGTPFGMLITLLKEEFPNYKVESPPIGDLQAFYKRAKVRFDEDADFKTRAYEEVVKLQAHEPEVTEAWQLICEVSRKEFSKIYERLDIKLEEKGESFYQDMMIDVVKALGDKLEDDETAPGRKIAWASCKKTTRLPLILVKSDGGFTYDTSDLACLRYRAAQAQWLVYVVDSGQSTHFQNVFSMGRDIGWVAEETRIDHVGFGVVLGPDGKRFKTRSGDTVRLKDLLDEGVERAKKALEERTSSVELSEEEAQSMIEAVAYGCIKYADLSHNRTNDYVFSFDKMLSDKGNTAVYLLYANARIRSIMRNPAIAEAGIDVEELRKSHTLCLSHPKEIKLAACLARFPEVIDQILTDLLPHHLCDYVYELSNVFTEYYSACYTVSKLDGKVTVDRNRLLLNDATGAVIDKGLNLLGIRTIDRM